MDDPYDLARFLDAQAGTYATALAEITAGAKRSHWMWFILPQLAGLGTSPTARRYALADTAEARAYLDHPVLGARLRACVAAALAVPDRSAHAIFGSPDDLKLRSCLTLFQHVAPKEPLFRQALERFFDGRPDPRTLELLS
jgi:uncharacterized protein (DUF1810 family)